MSGENEYSLKEYMHELKDTIKGLTETVIDLSGTVNDLRVVLVSEYVKKAECTDCRNEIKEIKNEVIDLQKKNDDTHSTINTAVIGAYVYVTTIFGIILAYWAQKNLGGK